MFIGPPKRTPLLITAKQVKKSKVDRLDGFAAFYRCTLHFTSSLMSTKRSHRAWLCAACYLAEGLHVDKPQAHARNSQNELAGRFTSK